MTKDLVEDVVDTLKSGGGKVAWKKPDLGEVVPLYGYITSIVSEDNEHITVQLNSYIHVKLKTMTTNRDHLKAKALEPGIFIGKVTGFDPISIDCYAVVFGKSDLKEQ